MRVSQIVKWLKPLDIQGHLKGEVTQISYNSHHVRPGSLFVAIPGERVDGHQFIQEAIEKGAVAVVHERPLESYRPEITYVHVKNSQQALAWSAAAFYGHPSDQMIMIGVTGTNGKTTTTLLIHAVLEHFFGKAGLVGTLEYRIGKEILKASHTTPQSLELQELFDQMVKKEIRYCVMEVSSHSLVQHRVEGIGYQVAVFTNLTQDHLDYHKTLEEYLRAKLLLFQGLSYSSKAVINIDDPVGSRFVAASKGKVITYGLSEKAMIRAENISIEPSRTRFMMVTPAGRFSYDSPLVGQFNIYNSLAAASVAYAIGLPIEKVLEAMRTVVHVPGRMERITPPGAPFTVIVDYAHTPDGLEKILKTARSLTHGRLITLFGCGGDRDRTKRPIMGRIAIEESDLVFITSDNPRSEDPLAIIEEIEDGIKKALSGSNGTSKTYFIEPDRRTAIGKALSMAREGDVVVLAGKGHETYQIFKDKTLYFDDREVAREFLAVLQS